MTLHLKGYPKYDNFNFKVRLLLTLACYIFVGHKIQGPPYVLGCPETSILAVIYEIGLHNKKIKSFIANFSLF